jgi:quercetin dioxygenase-like cupin family protein
MNCNLKLERKDPMRQVLLLSIAAAFLTGCQANDGMMGTHDEKSASSEHKLISPEQIKWEPAAALPPGARIAVLEGDPSQQGFFTFRAWLPDGYRIPAHWHPCVERVTVLSGMFYLGQGERFDESAATALSPGAYISMPPGMRHFAYCKGETLLQVSTNGPWGINYVDPADDPRRPAAAN